MPTGTMLVQSDVATRLPSKGGEGEKGAWFRDSEGNLLGIGQPVRSNVVVERRRRRVEAS